MSTTVSGGPPQIIEVQIPGGPPGPPGPPGPAGSSSLTELTDVTGDPGAGKAPVDDGSETFPLTRVVTQEDLDAILAAVAAVEWHDLELLNGCTNYGQGWAPCRYRLTLNNVVYLEGLIVKDPPFRESDAPLAIAVLPAECLPGMNLVYTVPSFGQNPARVDVQADGTIVFSGSITGTAETAALSLSGISFSTGGPSAVVEAALARRFGA